jgi:large subunit ribosomal protein L13
MEEIGFMSTYVAKAADIKRKWYVIDADGLILGRLASEVAKILRGKNKAEYTPFLDTGDYVIIVNASKIALTGKKLDQKMYRYHTNYPGGLKEIKYRDMMQKKPEKVVELAVKGMLPKNALGRAMFKKLKVYAGPEHEHTAQKPEQLTLSL